jgi:hypothetical protein
MVLKQLQETSGRPERAAVTFELSNILNVSSHINSFVPTINNNLLQCDRGEAVLKWYTEASKFPLVKIGGTRISRIVSGAHPYEGTIYTSKESDQEYLKRWTDS